MVLSVECKAMSKKPKQVPKEWPDSEGVWSMLCFNGDKKFWVVDGGPEFHLYNHHGERVAKKFRGQRFIKCEVVVPEVEQLPEKPGMVLCEMDGNQRWVLDRGPQSVVTELGTYWEKRRCTVIPHPDNDPELVKIIEEAK